ncbi:MAG: DNA-binding protein [Armatimonadetes bacterium]|nr:DNA-binding protein [Armatimonadota bacterium]
MIGTTPVSDRGSSESDQIEAPPSLEPLAPRYKASDHEVYLHAIEAALSGEHKDTIQNIALSGGYGVGKSSILQKVVETHKKNVVQISFSSIGLADLPDSMDATAGAPLSITNRIQKEIVKQLLYREDPRKMPGSRYRRIGRFSFWRQLGIAALAAGVVTLVFHLAGWTQRLFPAAESSVNLGWTSNIVVFAAATGFIIASTALFHNHVRIEKLSAGPATISLTQPSPSTTFFDEYLDEIVYFFEVTGRDIVIFEDIDRFGDPYIFETLRALNTLLNQAEQLEGRSIRFIYAIRDSVFDELGVRAAREQDDVGSPESSDALDAQLARTNRTKFFDLVIPIVPFITHKSGRDLVAGEMAKLAISDALIDLAGRHLVDMRLVRNVRNEFLIFRQKVPCGEGSTLALAEDGLFAMLLYKNMHLSDFEAIKYGKSRLDLLYRDGRRLVEQNLSRLSVADREARQRLSSLDSVAERSAALGKAVREEISKLERQLDLSTRRRNQAMTHAGQGVAESDLDSVEFWRKFLATDQPLEVNVQSPNTLVFRIGRQDVLDRLGETLSPEDWEEGDRESIQQRLRQNEADRQFLTRADMGDLMRRSEFTLTVDSGAALSFRDLATRHLESPMALQLVEDGYINRDFTLYTSIFHGKRVSAQAMNFIIHNVQDNVVDAYFSLTVADVEVVLRECGESVLGERGTYNINFLDFLLASRHRGLDLVVQSLTALGHDEQAFLLSYFADGKEKEALVREFALRWRHVFVYIVSELEVDEAARARLLNVALASMTEVLDYEVNDAVRAYLEGHYLDLDIFRSEATSAERGVLLARLLEATNAQLPSLTGLTTNVRRAVVAESLYEITGANLVAALDGHEELALDEIRSRDRIVYDYVLGRMPEYLTALREKDANPYTVGAAEAFKEVLEDVFEHSEEHLPEVIVAASPLCHLSSLANVPPAAWPALADSHRFPATFENVNTYVNTVGRVDAHVAGLLTHEESITVADGVAEASKVDLAGQLLAARDVLPEAELRTQLVVSLRLDDWLPASSIQPESGQLVGLLIEHDVVDDTAETFALALGFDWDTSEFAISKSRHFAEFMTPTEVPTEHIAALMQSGIVPDAVKSAIVERFDEFTEDADRRAFTEIARFALESGMTLPTSELVTLAQAGVDSRHVVGLLTKLLPGLGLAELTPVLQALGGEYAVVSTRTTKRPKLPNTESDISLVRRLQTLGVVSSHRESRGEVVVYMRRP